MRNQIKPAHQINLLSTCPRLFSGTRRNSLSGRVGKSSWNSHFSVYREYIYVLRVQTYKEQHSLLVSIKSPHIFLGFRKFSVTAVYSLCGSKVQRPTAYSTRSPFSGPCISESTTRDEWSAAKVSFSHFAVTNCRNSC